MGSFKLGAFSGIGYLPVVIELMEYITQEVFTIRDTGITQRVINHWDKEGILSRQGKFEGQWRRFSFVDYVWIKVVEELRSMGVSLPIIRGIREAILEPISPARIGELLKEHPEIISNLPDDEFKPLLLEMFQNKEYEKIKDDIGYSSFHLLVADTISKKENTRILAFKDGSYLLWNENQKHQYDQDDLEKPNQETHISVSILNVIKEFIANDAKLEFTPKLNLFEEHEIKLLEIVNSGKYQSLRIVPRSQESNTWEITKKENTWKKTIDLLMADDFQEIEIKSSKGVIMKIHNTRIGQ